jgi:hypothetical protein
MLDTAIIDLWAAEHRAVARWFYERVGRIPVGKITRKDVLTFKTKLIAEGATPANMRMKLSRLRALLQWPADKDYADTNAAQGITIKDTEQAKNKRREVELAAL